MKKKGGTRPREKGNRLERAIVQRSMEKGLEAKRAWGSNGEALGFSKEVDLVIENVRVQAKSRKSLPLWIKLPEGADAVVVKKDREKPLMLIDLDLFLSILFKAKCFDTFSSKLSSNVPSLFHPITEKDPGP